MTDGNTRTHQQPQPAAQSRHADVWRVVILDDLNRMTYVILVLRKVFGFSHERARKHMLEVHEKGRSIVWSGAREQAEAHVFALQQWHLTAFIQPDEKA